MKVKGFFVFIIVGVICLRTTLDDRKIHSRSFMKLSFKSNISKSVDQFRSSEGQRNGENRVFVTEFQERISTVKYHYQVKQRSVAAFAQNQQRKTVLAPASKIEETEQIKMQVENKFKDGIYYLTEVDFQGRFDISNSNDFEGEVEIFNNLEIGETEVRISNIKVASGPREVMIMDTTTKMIGQSIVNYNMDGNDYPMSVRTDGSKRIVMTAISGPFKGARMFFSVEKPEMNFDRSYASEEVSVDQDQIKERNKQRVGGDEDSQMDESEVRAVPVLKPVVSEELQGQENNNVEQVQMNTEEIESSSYKFE